MPRLYVCFKGGNRIVKQDVAGNVVGLSVPKASGLFGR